MWVKLLKDLYYERGNFVAEGTVVWLRRAGIVQEQVVNANETVFKQVCSVMTLEVRNAELILVLPEAEGNLYEQCEEPK